MNNQMIEKVARAIEAEIWPLTDWEGDRSNAVAASKYAARAAIAAYNPDERLREVTPAMASAGMHVLAEMPDHCDWIALAKYAAVIWRAMYDAAPLPQGDDT